MMPNKTCPKCSSSGNIRKLSCDHCGHVFVLRRTKRVSVKSRKLEIQTNRLCQSFDNVVKRREQVKNHIASMRATQTEQEKAYHQKVEKEHKAAKRVNETEQQKAIRKKGVNQQMAASRAKETEHQRETRRKGDKEHKAASRANETEQQKIIRRKSVNQQMAASRAKQTDQQRETRRKGDKEHKAASRANETEQQKIIRRKSVNQQMAASRAKETDQQRETRRNKDKQRVASKRSCTSSISLDRAIASFQSKIQYGPDYVCTSCHRMMYRQSVVECNKDKYTKASIDVLEKVFSPSHKHVNCDGKMYVCQTCHSALSRGNMPLLSKANGLQLNTIPPEMSDLNELETRLISLRVPFMKMVALPCGKQRSIHGPAVNVPTKIDNVCTVLPRLPSQSEMIPLKFKRKLVYKGHYMYGFVRPEKLVNALKWLKANNLLYANISINDDWVEEALNNDPDLFSGLLNLPNDEQSDTQPESMECEPSPQTELCDSVQSTLTTNFPVQESTDNMDISEASNLLCTDRHTQLVRAFHSLRVQANQKGYQMHDVSANGDCLYSAVLYQLTSLGICNVSSSSELREMVASHLESQKDLYCHFVVEAVKSGNKYNADTEAPNEEDELIRSVTDPEQRTQLKWSKYVRRVRSGAWGDNIVIAALCNMFNITINVLSVTSQYTNTVPVTPTSGVSQNEINIGLVMQYHFVALVQQTTNTETMSASISETSSDNSSQLAKSDSESVACDNDSTETTLDDATIQEGDEHTRNITGGPSASMLSLENPEATVCIAPCEGEKPKCIHTDRDFELMSNPDKFCYGKGGFNTVRPRKLTYRKYFNQRLLDVDGRFARDLDYLFAAQYIVESKQVFDDANNFIWRQKPSRQFTASQARNRNVISQFVHKDKAYRFLKNVRGSPPYYQRTFYELLAMIRQLGTPTWFFTLSAADMKWPDMIQTIARQYGVTYTDEEVASLSFEQKSNWLKRNPVTAARHFQYRLNTFFQHFLKSTANPLGEIEDYGIRIEFQARGSPHAHCVIWVKDAPRYGVSENSEVCDFIDKYISCAIPSDDGKLKDLVLLLQNHRHSSYCKRNNSCRFNFPHPPSYSTLIAEPVDQMDVSEPTDQPNVLAKVRKLIKDGQTDLSLDELLEKAEVNAGEYMAALEVSSKGSVIVLKREPNECCVNNYNSAVMLAWQANMDLQYVLNAYACIMYVASYIMKTDRAMGELLKRVANEARTDELRTQLNKVGSAFLTHREVSAQEAVYRILSLPMKQLSRSVVFVDTNKKEERIAVLKDTKSLKDLPEDDTNVFQKSLIDRYQHRPPQLQSMCLAEFAATYTTDYKQDSDSSDALPPSESDVTPSSRIQLTDKFGTMRKRKREAVIRFHKYNKDAEPSNWFRAKLLLYLPWHDEQTDLLGGYSSFEEHFQHVQRIVIDNESKYSQENIDQIEFDVNQNPEHGWNQLAPCTEESRAQSLAEGSEPLTEVSEQDLRDNADIIAQSSSRAGLTVRFESAANSHEIPADEYRELFRGLNAKQKDIVMFHRNWCKKAVVALKQNKPIEPYRVFLSGPGGVGKSHVIRLVHSDTLKLLKLSNTIEPDDVIVLLTAPTGVAAFNINGMTLHSAFLLGRSKYNGFQPLSHDRLNTLRSKLSNLVLVIIDEVSMVGSNMLLEIHKRLQQIKGVSHDITFGGVSILAVGDLYQLPPVGQSQLFSRVGDSYAQLYRSGSLWVDEFKMIELTQIMRQKDDTAFCKLLCRVRTNECTHEDIEILKSRITKPDKPDYPKQALHVYRLNVDVDNHNAHMLKSLASQNQQYSIKASDAVASQTTHIDLSALSNKRSETGGLHGVLKLAVGSRVMLTTNVDVSDGLVNGARGEVVHIVTNSSNEVKSILVNFDNSQVGSKAVQQSVYRNTYPGAVPISKLEVVFLAKGRHGSEITRLQFPLTLAWATTIHKVQGLTLDEIVVDMKGGRFNPGQAYVAFSRVKTLQGLHIVNFNASAIKKSNDVQHEMSRLNHNLLPKPSTLQCVSLRNSHMTIALLNVRSISSKLHDIRNNEIVQYASVLCLCETWLSPSQPSPVLCDNHVVFRSDRMSHDNKGGVMMSVSNHLKPDTVFPFVSNGIEGIVVRVLLPDANHLLIVLIYRSPTSPIQHFVATMTDLFNGILQLNCATIVLGDFNDNALVTPSIALTSLMFNHGFIQLVHHPTTDRGTLIDHVYYNRHYNKLIVEVHDTYYSDHDTIYCSIPLT